MHNTHLHQLVVKPRMNLAVLFAVSLLCHFCFANAKPLKIFQKQTVTLDDQDVFRKFKSSVSDGCPPQPIPQPLPDTIPHGISDAFDALASLGSQSVNSTNVPGVVMSVTYMGKAIWTKGFGLKDKKHSDAGPPDEKTIFRIGSISKIFPVTMLYQLYQFRLIDSLDDALTKYAPDFQIIDPFGKIDGSDGITLRQMASQLSGLQREAPCSNATEDNICPLTTTQMLKALSKDILIRPPWTAPSYSNLAYALIGRLMVDQYKKGMAFEDYVKEMILDPLELNNTGFKYTSGVKSKMAVGYLVDGSVAPLADLGWVGPAGQMYSNINDLNKLSEFFYQAHLLPTNLDPPVNISVLSAQLRREMSLPMFVNPDGGTGFGTPWEILYSGNYTIRTKGGNVQGYSSVFSFIPELHIGVNALFSGSFDEFTAIKKAYDIILPPFVDYLSQHPLPVKFPDNPDAYTGVYSFAEGNFKLSMNVLVKDRNMYIVIAGSTSFYLNYRKLNTMQIYYPPSLLPCMTNALGADEGEWVFFDPNYNDKGQSVGLTVPGLYLGLYFSRDK